MRYKYIQCYVLFLYTLLCSISPCFFFAQYTQNFFYSVLASFNIFAFIQATQKIMTKLLMGDREGKLKKKLFSFFLQIISSKKFLILLLKCKVS